MTKATEMKPSRKMGRSGKHQTQQTRSTVRRTCSGLSGRSPGDARTGRPTIQEQGATPMLVRLADWCYRRRRLVVLAWVAALAASFALASAFGGELRQDYLQPGSESRAASETLQESFPQRSGDTVQIVVRSDAGVTSPEAKARAEEV